MYLHNFTPADVCNILAAIGAVFGIGIFIALDCRDWR